MLRTVGRRTFFNSAINFRAISKDSAKTQVNPNVAEIYSKMSREVLEDRVIPEGAKDGTVPTDIEQATGYERLEILSKLEGFNAFLTQPLDASRPGTLENPIMVPSYDTHRIIGSTGYPAGSHEVVWMKLEKDKILRCPASGQVYKMKYLGNPAIDAEEEHH